MLLNYWTKLGSHPNKPQFNHTVTVLIGDYNYGSIDKLNPTYSVLQEFQQLLKSLGILSTDRFLNRVALSPLDPDPTANMSGDHKTLLKGSPSQYVKLNVGGTLFYTTIGTLTKSDNMLRTMFSGRMEVLTDSEGWILIDRCGKHFGTILNYLRDGTVALPDSYREVMELLAEAKYFLIEELTESCQQALTKKEREAEPICRVPLITSHKEEQLLIMSTSKPVVKLLINRHNNKYSYTNTSDDNLLKNIELFDKLSLRFSGRVLFIKDVIGSNEICCWSFFGHGKKCAEVCCTSIVYATDKKHTKVEFPEARIYEETLGILLYESRNGPDQDLIQATSSRGAVGGLSCTSDEEEERSGLARLRSNKQNNQS